jgi:hypothetical protein
VLVGESGTLQVFSAVGMPVEQLAAAQVLFAAAAERIARGETEATGDHCLAPLLDDGTLLGVLHVYGLPGAAAALEGYRLLLGAAVRASRQPGGLRSIDLLARTSAAELQRHQLVATLDGNEWNISRVARILGVTRRTVYMRMRKFRVPRRRVPKTLARPATA